MPRPVPGGIHIGAGSAARGRWSLSGSHHRRRRRTGRVCGHRWFNHRTHKDRAATISTTRRGGCRGRWRCRAGWRVAGTASTLAGSLPFVLKPERTVYGSEIMNVVRRSACANQICTLRADMSSFFASSARSSVDGNAVRAYVALSTSNWRASARLRFFLIVGSVDSGCRS